MNFAGLAPLAGIFAPPGAQDPQGALFRVVLAAAFGAAFCLVLGAERLLLARRRLLAARLARFAGQKRGGEGEKEAKAPDRGFFAPYLAAVGRLSPPKIRAAADRLLEEADLPLKGEELVAAGALAALAGFALGWLVGSRQAAVVLALAAGASPYLAVRAAISRRLARFNEQLADALMLMANSLRAGFGFLQALEVVQREMSPSLVGREFGRAFREMSLGVTVEEALQNLTRRVRSEDLSLVVTAVLIQRQVGGSLAEVLEKIAHTIRERVRVQGEIRTLTAQGRISGLIVGLLPLFLLAVMMALNPGYTGVLFTHPLGRTMLVLAALAEVTGWLLIKRITGIRI